MRDKYLVELRLKSEERPMIYNDYTQEIKEMPKYKNNIPEGKEIFEPNGIFKKDYTKSWEFLDRVLTPLEFKVVAKLCRMAKMNTNSLEPLNDDTTANTIAEEFNIGRNKVNPLFKKLFQLGVYARFEAYKPDLPFTKYWILNPYLSFSGKLIHSDIAKLFVGTIIEKEYNKS